VLDEAGLKALLAAAWSGSGADRQRKPARFTGPPALGPTPGPAAGRTPAPGAP